MLASTVSTASTMSANDDSTSKYGKRSPIASTACLSQVGMPDFRLKVEFSLYDFIRKC